MLSCLVLCCLVCCLVCCVAKEIIKISQHKRFEEDEEEEYFSHTVYIMSASTLALPS